MNFIKATTTCWGSLFLLGKEPVFHCEVFRVPKNETLGNNKTTCYAGGLNCFSLQNKTSNVMIMLVRQPH